MEAAILGIIRHLLTILAGVLVAQGVIDEGSAEILIGSSLGIAGVVWSVIEKRKR